MPNDFTTELRETLATLNGLLLQHSCCLIGIKVEKRDNLFSTLLEECPETITVAPSQDGTINFAIDTFTVEDVPK